MTSASEVINGALRLIGALAEGETPSAATSNDALSAFNDMLASWDTERLSVFSTQDQVFTWPASTVSRTIGPTGDFVGNRPVQVDDSTYFIGANGLSFNIELINDLQYNSIALKTVTSTYPSALWVNNTYPDVTLTIYPIPTQALVWHIVSVETLSQPAALSTQLTFPPGYLRAFRYNLACELAPEFGVEPSPQVKRVAMVSKRDLRRINNPGDVMAMPQALIASGGQRFNVYTGSMG